MRRIVCFALLAMTLAACKHRRPAEGAASRLTSVINMGDPRSANQLVSGFYGIEDNAWRWTGKSFSLSLHTPYGAARNGATLQMTVSVPAVVTEKEGDITLACSAGGTTLAPETYVKPGQYVYRRDVPAQALAADATRLDCRLDKAVPPNEKDLRELGIVVLNVRLSSK